MAADQDVNVVTSTLMADPTTISLGVKLILDFAIAIRQLSGLMRRGPSCDQSK
jgi:hypothetical protein